MKQNLINKAVHTALYASVLGFVLSGSGNTQETDNGDFHLEEIVVTARKTEESIQDIPIAVTAFSGEDLEDMQAENLDSLKNAVPNMNLVQGRGSASSANIYIRGIGQPDALQSFDPGVGIYVDGVYMSRIQGALMSLHDVERIEVLRGPQGTLYGKNTIGGAINVITKNPDAEAVGIASFTVGNYGKVISSVYAKGALGENTYASVSALYKVDNGFVTDAQTGQHFNDRDNNSLRFILRSTPTDSLEWKLSLDYTEQENALTLGRSESVLVGVDLINGIFPQRLPDAGEYDFQSSTSFQDDENQKLTHYGVGFTVDYNINENLDFKSISSYRKLDSKSFIDIDATTLEIGDVLVELNQKQVSQELQFLYNNENFNGVLGLYYLKETVPSHQEAYANDFLFLDGVPLDFLRTIDDDLETRSFAFFAQGNWDLNEKWGLTAGIRYSNDKKTYARTTSTFSDAAAFLEGTFAFNDTDSWSDVTPMLSVDYRLSEDHMVYASVSKGFKSGGFNGRANSEANVSAFDPETVWTYEIGGKITLADNRLRINYALFTSDYEDFQARVAEDISSFPVINAAELDISGAELEISWLATPMTTLYSSLGYLNSDYKSFFDFRQPDLDRSDDIPPFSPEWTLRLGFNHEVDISGGAKLRFGSNANFTDDMYLSVDNQQALTQDAYWVFNAYATYNFSSPQWSVTVGIKNIADEVYKVDAQEFSSVGNIQTAYYGDPRTWYTTLNYRF